ncbi:MAG TPA: hypothetical protein VFT58_02690, partial [Nitrososphaera sp.]|nr:hypothetical protein [Nitrososphaera sp.]
MAGYVIQTGDNIVSLAPVAAATGAGLASMAEIRMSRPYKQLKKEGGNPAIAKRLEGRLKFLSLATIAFSLALVAARAVAG